MATKANLFVDQGADFQTLVAVTDDQGLSANITGYTANGAFRKTYTSSNTYQFGTQINSGNGTITLIFTANSTANVEAGRYVYDVCTYDSLSGKYLRLVEGILTIRPRISKMTSGGY